MRWFDKGEQRKGIWLLFNWHFFVSKLVINFFLYLIQWVVNILIVYLMKNQNVLKGLFSLLAIFYFKKSTYSRFFRWDKLLSQSSQINTHIYFKTEDRKREIFFITIKKVSNFIDRTLISSIKLTMNLNLIVIATCKREEGIGLSNKSNSKAKFESN